jgi:uncharacterized membrane protein
MSDGASGTADKANRVPRWLMGFLIVSLAINFIFIGSVAGAMWRFHGPPSAPVANPGLLSYIGSLPADRRKALWDSVAAERQSLRPLRKDARAAREAMLTTLIADPSDKQAVLAAQARQTKAEEQARSAMLALITQIAAGLTPQERRAFPQWRDNHRPSGPGLLDEPDRPAHAKTN